MAVARSCRNVPIISPVVESFIDENRLGSTRVDVRARHRELGRPEVVHRVPERVHAIAVDVRDGAGAAEQQIAARRSVTPTASPGLSGPSNGISPARACRRAAAGRE